MKRKWILLLILFVSSPSLTIAQEPLSPIEFNKQLRGKEHRKAEREEKLRQIDLEAKQEIREDLSGLEQGFKGSVLRKTALLSGTLAVIHSIFGSSDAAEQSLTHAQHQIDEANTFASNINSFWSFDEYSGAFGSWGNLSNYLAKIIGELFSFMMVAFLPSIAVWLLICLKHRDR